MSQPSLDDYVAADHTAFASQIAEWLRGGFEEDDEDARFEALKKAG